MSNAAIEEISELPGEIQSQLLKVGDFYICTQFIPDMIGKPNVKIGGMYYYRFMDFMYLPHQPESLSPEQVKMLCDLRLEHMNELVNYQLNSDIVEFMAEYIVNGFSDKVSPIKALDFGCGSGLSSILLKKHVRNLEIEGVDISEKAVQQSKSKGLTAWLTSPGERLPFDDAIFDVIFAIFVMHFNVGLSTLSELIRILKPTGKFVFNIYQRDIDVVLQQLQEAGFGTINIWSKLPKINPKHSIVSCDIILPGRMHFIT